MGDLETKIKNLSEGQVVEVLNELHATVFASISFKEVMSNATTTESHDIDDLVQADADIKRKETDVAKVSDIARTLLLELASQNELATYVRDAINKVENSEHMGVVATIVAIGLLVNLTLLVASTEIKLENGKLTLHKKRVSPALMKEVVAPVKSFVDVAKTN